MDDVIKCLHLVVNIVFIDPDNIEEIVIMLRSQLEVKLLQNATFRIYMAAILKMCQTCNFYSICIRFGDAENMRLDTKIVFLSGLPVKILPKTHYIDWCMFISLLASKKNSSRMPSWHPPDSDSGSVHDHESIIKVHNDAKTRFSCIWPFGIWTICNDYRIPVT